MDQTDPDLNDILERLTDGIVALDQNWQYRYLNSTALHLLQRGKTTDLINKNVWEEFPEAVGTPFYENFQRAMRDQTPVFFETYYPPYDRWYEARVFPSPDGVTVLFSDTSERHATEVYLSQRLRFLNQIARYSPLAMAVFDCDFRFLVASQIFTQIYKLTDQNPIGRSITEVLPEQGAKWLQIFRTALELEKETDGEQVFYESADSKIWVHWVVQPWYEEDGQKGGLVFLSEIVTGRKRAEEELQKMHNDLSVLYAASRRLQQLLLPDELSQEIISVLESLLHYTFGAVLLIDPDDGTTLLPFALSTQGQGPQFVERDKKYIRSKGIRLGVGITGWVAEHGESVRTGDVRDDPRYFSMRDDIRSELCVPLLLQDRVIGVVNIETTVQDAYSEDDQLLLETVAAQIAVSIQNMRLYEQVQQQLERMNLLYSIGRDINISLDPDQVVRQALETLRSHTGSGGAAFLRMVPETGELVYEMVLGEGAALLTGKKLPPGKGISGWVARHNQSVRLADARQDSRFFFIDQEVDQLPIQTLITVPLSHKGKIDGVFQLYNKETGLFSQEDVHLLEAVARIFSISYENAGLYEQAQREISERILIEKDLEQHRARLQDEVAKRTRELHVVNEDLQLSLRHQSALAAIDLAIIGPGGLPEVLALIIESMDSLFAPGGGTFIHLADQTNQLRIVVDQNICCDPQTILKRLVTEPDSQISLILKNRTSPVVFQLLDCTESGDDCETGSTPWTVASLPLVIQDEQLGVMFVFERSSRLFTPKNIETMSRLANRAALAITKARTLETMQNARALAEETARVKSEFLAMMSHELRTPMAAIFSMGELLSETSLNPMQLSLVETLNLSTTRLLDLLNNVLDLSKIEARKIEINNQPFDLRNCIETTLDIFSVETEMKGLRLACSVSSQAPGFIDGDETRLVQVLMNLLGNALKFTDQGEILLSVTLQEPQNGNEARLLFAVHDTGIGIPADQLETIFTAFTQADTSLMRKYGGTGLGLTITRQIVELMGGRIWAESQGIKGEGSTLYFTILARPVDHPLPAYLQPEQPYLAGRRVLLTCDNQTDQIILFEMLTGWGMNPTPFNFDELLLAYLEHNRNVDYLVMGIRELNERSKGVANQLLNLPISQEIPVIACTPYKISLSFEQTGATPAYVKMPVKASQLYTALTAQNGSPEAIQPLELTQPDGQAPVRLRILVAEDDPVSARALIQRLEHLGHHPHLASTGLEALEKVQEKGFDVVFMDMHMPGMDGLEATRSIRRTVPADRQPFIIALTADVRQEMRQEIFAAGADIYLAKPVRGEQLIQVLGLIGKPADLAANRDPSANPPHIAEKAEIQTLDTEILDDFVQALGPDGSEALAQLLDLFSETAPNLLANMRRALSMSDWRVLRWNCHSLKGNCELLGAVRLAQLCKTLDDDIDHGRLAQVKIQVDQIADEYLKLRKKLTEKTSNLSLLMQ